MDVPTQATDSLTHVTAKRKDQSVDRGDCRSHANVTEYAVQQMRNGARLKYVGTGEQSAVEFQGNQCKLDPGPSKSQDQGIETEASRER